MLMNFCISLIFVFYFDGLIQGNLLTGFDSLDINPTHLSIQDSVIIDQRNDFIKQRLFENPQDSSLLEFAQETLVFSHLLNYAKGALMANERLGLIYQYTFSNPFKALDSYFQALSIAEENPELSDLQWGIKGNVGLIYYEQEEYGKSLKLFQEVAANSRESELTALLNIGNIYGAIHQNDSAVYYYEKALLFQELHSNPVQLANLYSNLSLIYVQEQDSVNALDMAQRSLNLVDSLDINFVKPTAFANAAMAYLLVGALDQSEELAMRSLKISQQQGNIFVQKVAWGTLSDIYAAKGNYKESLQAFQEFSLLKDSLNNQNRRVEINRRQMAFDFEKERDQAMAEIERQKLQRIYTLGIAVLVGLILLAIGYIYKKRRDTRTEISEAKSRALIFETELKLLRTQMNPHFIFNSLNSIGDYILKYDPESAQDYLSKFGKLMRMLLENSSKDEISLQEDLEFLDLYLQIESRRQPHKFSYSIEVDDKLDVTNVLVPPMLLQPFVENCIWHAFPEKNKMGKIEISFKVEEDTLHCAIEDNGVGRSRRQVSGTHQSMGSAITESRLRILNQRLGWPGRLQIIDKPFNSGTQVEISLPLILAF